MSWKIQYSERNLAAAQNKIVNCETGSCRCFSETFKTSSCYSTYNGRYMREKHVLQRYFVRKHLGMLSSTFIHPLREQWVRRHTYLLPSLLFSVFWKNDKNTEVS